MQKIPLELKEQARETLLQALEDSGIMTEKGEHLKVNLLWLKDVLGQKVVKSQKSFVIIEEFLNDVMQGTGYAVTAAAVVDTSVAVRFVKEGRDYEGEYARALEAGEVSMEDRISWMFSGFLF
jgi:hypothetical protein